ncbi:MAG: response regulator transcription factor [Flavipsychrobacter sp.]|nr:response regulator transcription factor [Flavipsychrobacter sp.]
MTTIKLCIADDHTLYRTGIINMMADFKDCEIVFEAEDGKTIIEKIGSSDKTIDICILDINMPGLNGYQTLKTIKQKWPDIKVLILSAYNNIHAIIKTLRCGTNGYMLKNCKPSELHEAILKVYHNGYYFPDFISGRMIYLLNNNSADIPVLTDEELDFLALCATDLTYKQIADIMCVSPRTIDKYSKVLFDKLNVRTRTALATFALNIGLDSSMTSAYKV